MRVVGIDENGLGPLLGPLLVTAANLELPAELSATEAMVRGRAAGIDDSKQSAGFGKMARAESVTLAAVEALHGVVPRTLEDLSAALAMQAATERQALCPRESPSSLDSCGTARELGLRDKEVGASALCWGSVLPLPAFGGSLSRGQEILATLAKQGIAPRDLRFASACVGRLNHDRDQGINKLRQNLSMFERLLLEQRQRQAQEVYALCGQVGGIRQYGKYFRYLGQAQSPAQTASSSIDVIEEGRARCAYRIAHLGEVHFEVKADAKHLPVAFASMVGKYLRELFMEQQNRFFQGHDSSLPRASGYHDPVTKRLVAASQTLRKQLAIEDRCFLRVS